MPGTRGVRFAVTRVSHQTIRGSVLNNARGVVVLESFAALEGQQLYQERQAHDLALQPLDQLDSPADRSAGGEKIVDDQHSLARLDGVLVDLKGVGAVLEGVLHRYGFGWKLAKLSDGDQPGVKLVGDWAAENEATRLHSHDQIYIRIAMRFDHQVDGVLV